MQIQTTHELLLRKTKVQNEMSKVIKVQEDKRIVDVVSDSSVCDGGQ